MGLIKTYGSGIYMTYDINSQLTEHMQRYGKYIIRNKINLYNYLIFDEDVAKLVYKNNYSIENQLRILKYDKKTTLKILHFIVNDPNYDDYYTSDIAIEVWKLVNKETNGIVFTGRSDGRVVVAYNISTLTPFGYAYVPTIDTEIVWNKIENAVIPAPDISINPNYERLRRKHPDNILLTLLAAVKQDGNIIKKIDNPSEEIQLFAVKQNPYAIQYINNPSETVQLAAVKHDGTAIQYINNPSEAVQLEAVRQYPFAIQYINNPSETVQLEAVQHDGRSIQYINNPSEVIQLEAVKIFGPVIRYIINPSEEIQLEAVKNKPYVIQSIVNPSEAVQLVAVKKNGLMIDYIKNPSKIVQLAAVAQDAYAIQYIENPSEIVQLTAVKKHADAFKYIKNPTKNVKDYVIKHSLYL